jgi:hypothetical protein
LKVFVSKRTESIRDQLENQAKGYVPFSGEMQVPPIRKMIGFGIVLLILLLLNAVGWIWAVIAGFRGSAGWGLLNMFFYPFAPVIYGFFVRKELGFRSGVWALVWAGSMLVIFLVAAITLG